MGLCSLEKGIHKQYLISCNKKKVLPAHAFAEEPSHEASQDAMEPEGWPPGFLDAPHQRPD